MYGVFARFSDDGDRLDFCQVDIVVLEDHQRLRKAANLMGNLEAEGSLVAVALAVAPLCQHQETCKILLMRFYPFFQDLQSELLCRKLVGDRGSVFQLHVFHTLGRQGGVVAFANFHAGERVYEFRTLTYSHWVRFDASDILAFHAGQRQQMHMNRQVQLAYNAEMIALQEEVVREYTTGDGVFYRHYSVITLSFIQAFAEGVKR